MQDSGTVNAAGYTDVVGVCGPGPGSSAGGTAPLPRIFPIFLPHFRLYEVYSRHMCVLPYTYRKILGTLLKLMKLCVIIGALLRDISFVASADDVGDTRWSVGCAYATGQTISNDKISPLLFENGAKSGFEMWFGPSTLYGAKDYSAQFYFADPPDHTNPIPLCPYQPMPPPYVHLAPMTLSQAHPPTHPIILTLYPYGPITGPPSHAPDHTNPLPLWSYHRPAHPRTL